MRQRLPPLDWHGAVRLLQADRALAKYNPDEPRDWYGRWTTMRDWEAAFRHGWRRRILNPRLTLLRHRRRTIATRCST